MSTLNTRMACDQLDTRDTALARTLIERAREMMPVLRSRERDVIAVGSMSGETAPEFAACLRRVVVSTTAGGAEIRDLAGGAS